MKGFKANIEKVARRLARTVTALLCLLLVVSCAGQERKVASPQTEPNALTLRVGKHPGFVRIVFEGTDERFLNALVKEPEKDIITVQFPGPVTITHETKGLVEQEVPVEVLKDAVAMVHKGTLCTLVVLDLTEAKVSTLSSPPRLVIDASVTPAPHQPGDESTLAPKQVFRKGSEPDGFRGIKWKTDIKKVSRLKLGRTDPSYGGIDLYEREADETKLGNASLESVEYGFWRGRFSYVVIKVNGFANWQALKDAVFSKYGKGFKTTQAAETYWWAGSVTTMKLEYREAPDLGFLYLYSSEIMKQQEEYDAKKAKEVPKKGF